MQERLAEQPTANQQRETLEHLNNLEDLGLEEPTNQMELVEAAVAMLVGNLVPLEAGWPQADGIDVSKDEQAAQ